MSPSARRGAGLGAALLLASAAAYPVVSSLDALTEGAYRHAYSDQWRVTVGLVNQGIFRSLVRVQNGHRPVLPGIVLAADVKLLRGGQTLPVAAGVALAALCVLLWGFAIRSADELPIELLGASLPWVTWAVFWSASGATLYWGWMTMELFLALGGTLLGLHLLLVAGRRQAAGRPLGRTVGSACLAFLAASFSFGAGLAAWPAGVLAGLLAGLPRRVLTQVVCAGVLCGVFYFVLLPSPDPVLSGKLRGPVHEALRVSPWINLEFGLAWLGAPLGAILQHGWLGSFPHRSLARLGVLIPLRLDFLRWILMPAAGTAGLLLLAVVLGRRLRAGRWAPDLEALGLSASFFALLVGAQVSLARAMLSPDFATRGRYFVWSSTFWVGLVICGLAAAARTERGRGVGIAAWVVASLSLPLFLRPPHLAGMAANLDRRRALDVAALAAVLGADSDRNLAPFAIPDGVRAVALETYRSRGLDPFSSPLLELLGRPAAAELGPLADGTARGGAWRGRPGVVGAGETSTGHFQGRAAAAKGASAFAYVVAVGPDGTIVGLGKPRRQMGTWARRYGFDPLEPWEFEGFYRAGDGTWEPTLLGIPRRGGPPMRIPLR